MIDGPLKYIRPHWRVTEGDSLTGDLTILIETPERSEALRVYEDACQRNGARARWRVKFEVRTLDARRGRVNTQPVSHGELVDAGLIARDAKH